MWIAITIIVIALFVLIKILDKRDDRKLLDNIIDEMDKENAANRNSRQADE